MPSRSTDLPIPSQCAAAGIPAQRHYEPECTQLRFVSLVQQYPAALRPDARRGSVPIRRPYRRERARLVRAGQHHLRTGASTWEFAETCTTALRSPARRSLASASPTTFRKPTPFCVSPTRAQWRRPFNENLVLSSIGCSSDVLNPLLGCSSSTRRHWNPAIAMSSMPACSRPSASSW